MLRLYYSSLLLLQLDNGITKVNIIKLINNDMNFDDIGFGIVIIIVIILVVLLVVFGIFSNQQLGAGAVKVVS